MVVAISEDATAVNWRREYYSKWNSVLGCSLPIHQNGLPDRQAAIVEDAADINRVLKTLDRVTSALVFMAQLIAVGSTPLRLCSFGSNNKYTAKDVLRRLETITYELIKAGIEVIT